MDTSPDTLKLAEQRCYKREYMRRYNQKPENRAKALQRKARYRASHRAALAQQERVRYYANHEQELVERKEKRQDPVARAKQRVWAKNWEQRNLDKVKASFAKYRSSERGRYIQAEVKGRRKARERGNRIESRINWRHVWSNFNGTCGICAKPLILGVHTYHFDHIVALARGGAHATANLQVAHAKCNLTKNRY